MYMGGAVGAGCVASMSHLFTKAEAAKGHLEAISVVNGAVCTSQTNGDSHSLVDGQEVCADNMVIK